MTTQKMSTRKMFETLVRKCSERKIYSVKVIDIEDGAVFEAKHPIDLIFTTAKTWNHLWVLEVFPFKVVENQVLVIPESVKLNRQKQNHFIIRKNRAKNIKNI